MFNFYPLDPDLNPNRTWLTDLDPDPPCNVCESETLHVTVTEGTVLQGLHKVNIRAVDPHSFYADSDPAVFLNADPDPGPGPA